MGSEAAGSWGTGWRVSAGGRAVKPMNGEPSCTPLAVIAATLVVLGGAGGVNSLAFTGVGLLGAREIAAIVSVSVLLEWERSLFDIARSWRSASKACNSSLVL